MNFYDLEKAWYTNTITTMLIFGCMLGKKIGTP